LPKIYNLQMTQYKNLQKSGKYSKLL